MIRAFSCCVVVTLFLLVADARLHAEVLTINGTIKSVDSKSRNITVEANGETKSFDVSSKAKILIEGKDNPLDALKAAQKIKLTYHDDLEVVLKIEVVSSPSKDAKKSESIKYKKTGCRAVWQISETGDSHLPSQSEHLHRIPKHHLVHEMTEESIK